MEAVNEALRLIAQTIELIKPYCDENEINDFTESVKLLSTAVDTLSKSST